MCKIKSLHCSEWQKVGSRRQEVGSLLRATTDRCFYLAAPQLSGAKQTITTSPRGGFRGRWSRACVLLRCGYDARGFGPYMSTLQIGFAAKHFEYPLGSLVITDEPTLKEGEKLFNPTKRANDVPEGSTRPDTPCNECGPPRPAALPAQRR